MALQSLLCLDVGGGTQDILFWQADRPIENALKMVLPSPTQIVAKRIQRATRQGRPVFLHGWLMGGGAMAKAARDHVAAGLAFQATARAAASFHDDPERVRAMGFAIGARPPAGAARILASDLDLKALRAICLACEIDLPSRLAVALCDHGFSPRFSNRKFRFAQWERFLAGGGRLLELIGDDPPPSQTRLRAASAQWPGCLVMDTAAAALWGALQDPLAAAHAERGLCLVNLGNEHTVAFLMADGRVWAVYEHHTGLLTPALLADHLARFIAGRITDAEVFDGRGHGCARAVGAPDEPTTPIFVTGPQRALARDLGWTVAAPHGDVMLSGCFGLLAAAQALDAQQAAPRS